MLKLKIISSNNVVTPCEEIRMDQTPTNLRWKLIPLYKMSISDNMLFWQIGFDGNNKLEIQQGVSNELLQTNYIELSSNKDALYLARCQYKLKYREGYIAGEVVPLQITAMKAYDYNENSINSWPVFTQPKINGIRMICNDLGKRNISMKSWLNNSFDNLSHLTPELSEFFEYLPANSILDGELYNHNMNFSTLVSAVKTVKIIHPQLLSVGYHIFDINYNDSEGTPFEKRYTLLVHAFQKYIEDKRHDNPTFFPQMITIVPTQIATNHNEIILQHDSHVANNYEGIMIKKISNNSVPGTKRYNESLYRQGKCNHILKYKHFHDEEGIIVDISNFISTNTFQVRDIRGNIFSLEVKGNQEQKIQCETNPNILMGKQITFKYKALTSSGVPISPIGIMIRDYE